MMRMGSAGSREKVSQERKREREVGSLCRGDLIVSGRGPQRGLCRARSDARGDRGKIPMDGGMTGKTIGLCKGGDPREKDTWKTVDMEDTR